MKIRLLILLGTLVLVLGGALALSPHWAQLQPRADGGFGVDRGAYCWSEYQGSGSTAGYWGGCSQSMPNDLIPGGTGVACEPGNSGECQVAEGGSTTTCYTGSRR